MDKLNSSKMLDRLTEFLLNAPEDRTIEELIEDLEAKGIDTKKLIKNVKKIKDKYLKQGGTNG